MEQWQDSQTIQMALFNKKSLTQLSLDELYTEIHSGDTPETKPIRCNHWVCGWDATIKNQ